MQSLDNYIVNRVTYDDFIILLKLYHDFHNESRGKDIINFDSDRALEFLYELLEDPDIHIALKCSLGDDIVGFFFGSMSSMSYSSTPLGFERGFFVRKESRGTRAAYMLRDAYDTWAKEHGAVATIDTIFYSDNNDVAFKFMEKSGRKEIGKVYERVL